MPTVVQSTSAVADNPTNFGLAFREQVTAGNLLLCAVQANGKAVTAVADTAGNNWALAASAPIAREGQDARFKPSKTLRVRALSSQVVK